MCENNQWDRFLILSVKEPSSLLVRFIPLMLHNYPHANVFWQVKSLLQFGCQLCGDPFSLRRMMMMWCYGPNVQVRL